MTVILANPQKIAGDTLYDEETFPNYFCCVVKHIALSSLGIYEISGRRNDALALVDYVLRLERMVGYNNINFDYPIMHALINAVRAGEVQHLTGEQLAARLYEMCLAIIGAKGDDRFRHRIWDRDMYVPQLDLMLVHGMDIASRMTSLKALQFAMRSPKVQEIPIEVGTWLTPAQMDVVADYCCHDVWETGRFYEKSRREIEFREALGPEFMNLGETRIGKKILRDALEKAQPGCTKKQTIRPVVPLAEVVLPYIGFQTEPFQRVHRAFMQSVIDADRVKQSFAKLSILAGGFQFDFGVGGLHGSIRDRLVVANDEYELLDIDVTSFYPRMAIINRMRPAHLGDTFTTEYNGLFDRRQTYPKGTPENVALKFGLNGVFGDSGNEHSVFRDLAFMLGITVNGQLLLCMCAEALLAVPGLVIIQANTDGLTVRFPRSQRERVAEIVAWWQWGTGLQLEHKNYELMHIRDVNNYLARDVKGEVKRKGAYEYKLSWWQDHSMLAVPRAAEAAILTGEPPVDYLRRHAVEDPWDFLMRARVTGKSRLTWSDFPAQKTARFYVSTQGAPLVKYMPAKRKRLSLTEKTIAGWNGQAVADVVDGGERQTQLLDGRPVRLVDEFDGRTPPDLDFAFYEAEVRKLLRVRPLAS